MLQVVDYPNSPYIGVVFGVNVCKYAIHGVSGVCYQQTRLLDDTRILATGGDARFRGRSMEGTRKC